MNPRAFHEIRDPVHGAIRFTKEEYEIIFHPFFQRLRNIRQLGFSQIPFPGATHTRFCHSIGVAEVAARSFDMIFSDNPLSSAAKTRSLRQCAKLAALLHDIGHGPFSHAAELAMPAVEKLGMSTEQRQASHEDYTIAMLCDPSFSQRIEQLFGFTGYHISALINSTLPCEDDFFLDGGCDYRTILSQLISSNLDADRLDYLVRDSFFSGVRYGQVDVLWLVNHMRRHISSNGMVHLAIDKAAFYALEDFLLSRIQMFVNVYFHQKSVGLELMLQQFMNDPNCGYQLPYDLNEYVQVDDAQLWTHMRASDNEFARRIVNIQPYQVAAERHGLPEEVDLHVRQLALEEAGIHVLPSCCIGQVLSTPKKGKPSIYMLGSHLKGDSLAVPLEKLSFQYSKPKVCISRLYVPSSQLEQARQIMNAMSNSREQQSLL